MKCESCSHPTHYGICGYLITETVHDDVGYFAPPTGLTYTFIVDTCHCYTAQHSIEAGYARGIFWRTIYDPHGIPWCVQSFAAGPIETYGPLPDLRDIYEQITTRRFQIANAQHGIVQK
jgi:hypothetical protein